MTAAIDSWEGSLGGGQTALLVEKCLHFSKQLQPVPLEHQMMRPFAGDHQPFFTGARSRSQKSTLATTPTAFRRSIGVRLTRVPCS